LNNSKINIEQFLEEQRFNLKESIGKGKTFEDIKSFPLTNAQCLYIHDFQKQEVTFHKNVTIFLGYLKEEFNSDLIHSYIHPDDEDLVLRLIRAAVLYVSDRPAFEDGVFSLTYRVRKKDGSYLKVLRQSSVYETDQNGIMISNLSVLSDIGFIHSGQNVDWTFISKDYDEAEFRKYVGQQYNSYFTPRELEIIQWINEGMSSKDIANKHSISSHTVDTHRRKILKKAGCKNTIELLNFCNKIGVLRQH
jgi:DNA-binding CsgD family transcriptional regulator